MNFLNGMIESEKKATARRRMQLTETSNYPILKQAYN
jgi:hypothetical protein